jgi:P4 family phage/plasmid primase-like protien
LKWDQYIGRESVSSGIHKTGEEPPKYNKRFHIYFFLKDISLSALKEYLEIKLWDDGNGYIDLSRNGAMLTRTIVDLAVFSPERLIYEASPVIGPGLSTQELRWFKKGGGHLAGDLNLTEEEKTKFKQRVADAKNKPEIQSMSNELKEKYFDTQVDELVKHEGISPDEAKKALVSLSNINNVLPKAFVIDLGDKKITVEELLANGKEYDQISMPDPIEGIVYGSGKARFYYNDGKNPCINSFAHGGQLYSFEGFENQFKESNAEEFQVLANPTITVLAEKQQIIPTKKITDNLGETEADIILHAIDIVMAAEQNIETDPGALFEPHVLAALRIIRKDTEAEYQRFRLEAKKKNNKISLTELDRQTRVKITGKRSEVANDKNTHDGYARGIIDEYTVNGCQPVGFGGGLWVYDDSTGIWKSKKLNEIKRKVTENYDDRVYSHTSGDYTAISEHVLSLVDDLEFFNNAPFGLATPKGFYRINGKEIKIEPLSASHRQRVMLPVTPNHQPMPLFKQFLDDTFASNEEEESNQQITLLQEIVGAIILGYMHFYQKAVLFYEPYGRAGKGVMVQIIQALVPEHFVSHVSPFDWDREYYLAKLVGKKLNVVGELPENKPIPASAFKSIIGGDNLSGRQPTEKVVSFKNEAGHIFSSNHLIKTNDFTEAFYSRWLILHFPNSRIKLGKPLDEKLAINIIDQELPGVAQWALDGAIRRLGQEGFSHSNVHDYFMEKWRRDANSLMQFIKDSCETGNDSYVILRTDLYSHYKNWCREFGVREFSVPEVKELLINNVRLGVKLKLRDGYQTWIGIKLKPLR